MLDINNVFEEAAIEVNKGGKGSIDSKVKAPNGEYIHERKTNPKKYTEFRTKKLENGTLLRLGKLPDGKWELQAVLKKA